MVQFPKAPVRKLRTARTDSQKTIAVSERRSRDQRISGAHHRAGCSPKLVAGPKKRRSLEPLPLCRAFSCIVPKVAPTDSRVIITGETGTGKELVACPIPRRSNRSSHAFVSVNCTAIPHDLIASELLGQEKGAFTGAMQRRVGRFELAEGGTIFLDEVGELSPDTQVALFKSVTGTGNRASWRGTIDPR